MSGAKASCLGCWIGGTPVTVAPGAAIAAIVTKKIRKFEMKNDSWDVLQPAPCFHAEEGGGKGEHNRDQTNQIRTGKWVRGRKPIVRAQWGRSFKGVEAAAESAPIQTVRSDMSRTCRIHDGKFSPDGGREMKRWIIGCGCK